MGRNPRHDFWINILYAMHFQPALAVPNGPRLTGEVIEKEFRLTPHTAEGFVEKEFDFLQPDELGRLKSAVAGVRAVAMELGDRLVATDDEKRRALSHFQAIVNVLEPDRFMEPEAFEIGKRIEANLNTPWPAKLDHLRFMSGLDNTGDPALWVWAFVKESVERDESAFFLAVDQIDPLLEKAAGEVAPDRWPYISFRSALVQPEVEVAA